MHCLHRRRACLRHGRGAGLLQRVARRLRHKTGLDRRVRQAASVNMVRGRVARGQVARDGLLDPIFRRW